MTPELHARVQEIFEAAIELPANSRIPFLDSACDGDADLHERIVRLIAAADDTDTVGSPLQQHPPIVVRECPRCSRCFDEPISNCPIDASELDVTFSGPLLIDEKYRIERRLGRGGMGAVYLAQHIGLEKYFAVKLISVEGAIPPAYRVRFENEARALGRLKHPNIVEVTDYGIDSRGGGLPYLVMEYLEGGTVRERLRHTKPLPFFEAIALLRQVAAGIDAAHTKDIVHGDLKPANLLLGSIPKIVDFGLARLPTPSAPRSPGSMPDSGERSTASGTVRGTPAYMAPELFRRDEASKASDQFAFGVFAYEILTGELPFGRHAREVQKNLQQLPTRPSEQNRLLPPELDAAIMAALSAIPEMRPQSASALVATLEAAWISAEQRRWLQREFPRRLVIAVAVAMIVVFGAALSPRLRFVKMVEERTIDWRFGMLPKRSPDPRLLVVSLDDQTLASDPRPLTMMANDFGEMINRLFAAGVRAVAIDILLPDWSQSEKFASAVQSHADDLALAKFSGASGVVGPECIGALTALLLGPQRYDTLFGFVNLEEDEDRRIRHSRVAFLDRNGHLSASFAERAVARAGLAPPATTDVFWVDYSVHARDIPVMSWKDTAARLQEKSAFFSGKLVILGGDYTGNGDVHRVPDASAAGLVSGAVVQALIGNTILEGFPVTQSPLLGTMMAIGAASFLSIVLALRFPHRPVGPRTLILGLALGYLVLAFLVFRSRLSLIVVAAPEIALLLAAVAIWWVPSRLSPYPTALPPEVPR